MVPNAAAEEEQDATGRSATNTNSMNTTNRSSRVRRRKQEAEGVDVRVPVAFNQPLTIENRALLLAEVLRHILFMRGQLPMPHQQLLKILEEREEWDRTLREEKAARVSEESRTGVGAAGLGGRTATRRKGKKINSTRPLAKASAHRRARKALAALHETTLSIEQAFLDAADKGRHVLEALILMGASHLSPREIYSMIFPAPPPVASTEAPNGGRGGEGVQGKASADAYSRKLVRCLVGGMSGVTFRGLGSCRVHIFLRLADPVVQVFDTVPARVPSTAHAADTVGVFSVEEAIDENTRRSDSGSHKIVHNSSVSSAHRARCAVPGSEASSPASLLCLVPRPRFKIRLSRTRPAPKVSIVVSRRTTATNPNHSNRGAAVAGSEQGRGQGPQNIQDGGSAELGEGVEGRAQEHGVWYQLVCARLAGLKGCESLAS